MTQRKIALFGGTFDPIHLGHIKVADAAAKHIGAEQVVFIPAKRSPLKTFCPKASDQDRLNMIDLAIKANEQFQVSDYELKKPEPSYTLETVRKFQVDYSPQTKIYWLIGADTIHELPGWYKILELIDECNLSAMYRAGCQPPDFARFEALWGSDRVEKLRRNVIQTPLVDISSTEIRASLAARRDINNMVWPAVAKYIHLHRLYQEKTNL